MTEKTKSILLNIWDVPRISVIELAQWLEVPTGYLIKLFNEYSIGMITEGGYLYFENISPSAESDKAVLEESCKAYKEGVDLEKAILKYIEERQPTTLHNLYHAFKMSREKMWAILDYITLKDGDLWEVGYKNQNLLFYGDKLADEYGA